MHDRNVVSESQLNASPGGESASQSTFLTRFLQENGRNMGLVAALLAWLIVLAIFSPKYMNLDNFIVVGLQVSYVGIASIGMAFLIISGNVDLSIGSLFGLCAATAAILSLYIDPVLALLAGILLSGILGLINGALVWRIRISPIIITLGSLTILYGVVLLMTGGYTVRGVPKAFGWIGQAHFLGVPTPVWMLIVMAVLAHFILHTTTLGRHLFAIGGNREASEASGLNVRRLVLGVFAVNGLIVGLSGVLAASRFGTAAPSFGVGYELNVITAVILGGVAFTGGEGNIIGVMLAVILLGVIDSGLVSLGVDPHYTQVVKGARSSLRWHWTNWRTNDKNVIEPSWRCANGTAPKEQTNMPHYELEGNVAIVTGGGRGIGRAIALRLAREGASVTVADLNEANARQVAQEIESAGGKALALKVDVTRKEDANRMVLETVKRFGKVTILVNNAGIGAVSAPARHR